MIISGVVTDPSGQPVAGAVVAVAAAPVPVPDIAGLTGEDGRFSVIVPAVGRYVLTVHGERGMTEIHVVVQDEAAEVNVEVSL